MNRATYPLSNVLESHSRLGECPVWDVELPVQCPTCCTFGGKDLTDLYITSASLGLSQQEIQKCICSGDLFCLQTAIAGMPTYSFGKGDRPLS